MANPSFVKTLVQSTREVEPERAFEFWQHSVLAAGGVDTQGSEQTQGFAAGRFVARATHSVLLHTKSDEIAIARLTHHIRKDDVDMVSIAMFLRGSGYFEQGNRGARMVPGDISIVDTNRPFQAGGYEAYEELRIHISRSVFQTHVGEPEAFAGRMIRSGPHSTLFANYLQTYASLVGQMPDVEAGVAIEGALHLLRSFTTTSEVAVSTEALRSLAMVHIERCLHNPGFGPDAMCKSLCVSRTRLYAAFADGEGVAASIRDARLDRARRYLSDPAQANESIATIMIRCGFTDASTFSRAFSRRFGISARDTRPR
ncbi:helix-turn-helix domain-containing protein [Methylobacterium sp. BTF04]|uniref:helix-turn-helix domain-containing protein n=1 Tax=Methylobacterium sp. BTF04 TaxID=2708300 RepID=UPI0013D3E7E5|nr:helix-turn-helix domain-containing protein [Methylobacterium sp. BTF04]NEU12724.1 helix-turn-helix domain-containing protein [Methylobacterium sp. BTF04]